MAESTEIIILHKMSQAKRGKIFFVESFISFGNAKAVSKALQRLTQKGEIMRVANGIYVKPKISKFLGVLTPSIEEVATAIAKRDKARIVPTGVYALNRLGISTQVPLNIVYLTDGASRKVQIGKRVIKFKKVTPKNLATKGTISTLVIQALKALGKDKANVAEIQKLQEQLRLEKQSNLKHDYTLAPEWIRRIMHPIINF
jgi:predicted transcriptional regulator of viral defense system